MSAGGHVLRPLGPLSELTQERVFPTRFCQAHSNNWRRTYPFTVEGVRPLPGDLETLVKPPNGPRDVTKHLPHVRIGEAEPALTAETYRRQEVGIYVRLSTCWQRSVIAHSNLHKCDWCFWFQKAPRPDVRLNAQNRKVPSGFNRDGGQPAERDLSGVNGPVFVDVPGGMKGEKGRAEGSTLIASDVWLVLENDLDLIGSHPVKARRPPSGIALSDFLFELLGRYAERIGVVTPHLDSVASYNRAHQMVKRATGVVDEVAQDRPDELEIDSLQPLQAFMDESVALIDRIKLSPSFEIAFNPHAYQAVEGLEVFCCPINLGPHAGQIDVSHGLTLEGDAEGIRTAADAVHPTGLRNPGADT